ncbi:biotin--[acetyl-CoA-carboxylase] ligase [Wenyingzhuangia sp. IMCC45574]
MNIIKLNAIDSTSRFLKDLSKKEVLENFTVVVAEAQTQGRGQRNTVWHSEPKKNLLFTLYVDLQGVDMSLAPVLNFLVAEKLREVLDNYVNGKGKIKIKWPNDILSYHQKIAGVLVENTVKGTKINSSLVGVGLNVNQIIFPENLPKATSLIAITKKEIAKDDLLFKIVESFKSVLTKEYILNNKEQIKQSYLKHLYRLQTPAMFKDVLGTVFMGKIIDVSNLGKLVLEKEDEKQYEFDIKEISFL